MESIYSLYMKFIYWILSEKKLVNTFICRVLDGTFRALAPINFRINNEIFSKRSENTQSAVQSKIFYWSKLY